MVTLHVFKGIHNTSVDSPHLLPFAIELQYKGDKMCQGPAFTKLCDKSLQQSTLMTSFDNAFPANWAALGWNT